MYSFLSVIKIEIEKLSTALCMYNKMQFYVKTKIILQSLHFLIQPFLYSNYYGEIATSSRKSSFFTIQLIDEFYYIYGNMNRIYVFVLPSIKLQQNLTLAGDKKYIPEFLISISRMKQIYAATFRDENTQIDLDRVSIFELASSTTIVNLYVS